jgi:hypothetical protein
MTLQRTELLFERASLTKDGRPKKRTRDVLMGKTTPERRDLYARLERRFRDAITSTRTREPARTERRSQSLNRRRGGNLRIPFFRLPTRSALVQSPRRAGGGIGILRNR